MNRNVLLLALCQALTMTVIGFVLAASVSISHNLSVAAGLATVPLAAQYLATLLALQVAARLLARFGRQKIFVAGALCGAAGLGLAALAVALGHFPLFVLAGIGIGVQGATGQYYRFAALEAVPAAERGLAVSLTLSGGVLAAFLGPFLARGTRHLLDTPFVASFLILAGLSFLAAVLAGQLRLPAPAARVAGPSRPIAAILRDGRLRLALAAGAVGYGVMNLLMTATPLAMLCARLDFDATAEVIQWHLLAMFAPSFVTGHLIRRWGSLPVMLAGCVALLLAVGVALGGDALGHFQLALVGVGLGWNFLYVGATTRLAECWQEADRARLQALNDSLVFLVVCVATFAAGPLVDGLGWERVNILAALPVLMVAVAVLRAWRRPLLAPSA